MLLMLVQIVPVQQIGNALSQNQWTEELPHGNECDIDGPLAKAFLPTHVFNHSFDIEASSLIYIHTSDGIPSNHSTDVVSPPPDFLPECDMPHSFLPQVN